MTNAEKTTLRHLCKAGKSFQFIKDHIGASESTIRKYMKIFSPKTKKEATVKADTALNKSIAHWRRMIAWAELHDKKTHVDSRKMIDAIGEDWSGYYCPLCFYYQERTGSCNGCPLRSCVGTAARRTLWRAVVYSNTWGEWLVNAGKLLARLEKLKARI